jgi:hypothetical protein
LPYVVSEYDQIKENKRTLGLALHQQFDRSLALVNGLAGHSGAILGEAYRREGEFVLEKLLK